MAMSEAAGEPAGCGRQSADLWHFSCAFYAQPGVSEALLALQDRAGLDVNLILFALWRGACGQGCLSHAQVMAAERRAETPASDTTLTARVAAAQANLALVLGPKMPGAAEATRIREALDAFLR